MPPCNPGIALSELTRYTVIMQVTGSQCIGESVVVVDIIRIRPDDVELGCKYVVSTDRCQTAVYQRSICTDAVLRGEHFH